MLIPTWSFCDRKECRDKRTREHTQKSLKKQRKERGPRPPAMRLRLFTCKSCNNTIEMVCGHGKKLCNKCFNSKYKK